MGEPHRSPLSRGQVQVAKQYESVLETLNEEFPDPFKYRDVTARFEEIGHGDLLRLKKAGLLGNEYSEPDAPKDWHLTQSTNRWLRIR